MEALERRQHLANLLAVIVQSTSVVRLFKCLVGFAATHVSVAVSTVHGNETIINLRALRSREERSVTQIVNLLLPRLARLIRWIYVLDPIAFTVLDHIRDPPSLHLDGGRSIGEQGGTLRAVKMEHVGISGDSGAEVGVRSFLPLVVKSFAVDVPEAHGCHAACDDIEAGSDTDDIEVLVGAILQIDACFVEAGDGIVLDVDHIDIVSIELLQVGILEARSLDAPVVWHFEWCKDVFLLRIIDSCSLLFRPEVVCRLI